MKRRRSLYAHPKPFSEESNAPRVRSLVPTTAGGAAGMVADIAKLSVGREAYYTRELATDHEQYLSGHGESPGRWYGAGANGLGLEGEASVAGFQVMFEGRDPSTGELLGRPRGRDAVPVFDVVLRPTRACRSSTASATRPSDGPCWPPITPGWPKRSVTWTDTLGPAVAMAVSSTCPARASWPSASTTGHPVRAIRWCTPTWWWPTGSKGRTAAGRPWTAGTCTGIGWPPTPSTGPPTNGSCPGHSGSSGRRPTAMATGSSRGCPKSW